MDDEIKLEAIVIIAKFDDGECRQLLIKKETQEAIILTIVEQEGEVKVLDKVLDTIDIQIEEERDEDTNHI